MTNSNILHFLLLFLVFAGSALLVLAVAGGLQWLTSPLGRRLKAGGDAAAMPATRQEGSFEVHLLEPITAALLPEDGWRRSHLRLRLVRAGLRGADALPRYLAAKLLLGLGLPLLAGLVLLLAGKLASNPGAAVLSLGALALLGFFTPNLYLLHRIEERQQNIAEGFPDGLDMLVVCVEAGLSLDAAILRVSQEMQRSHPELAEELGLVSLELRAGRSREEALHALAERAGVEDIRAFIGILVQAQHFGTSIAASLRVQASDLRLIRMQRAREKAGKLPVKLIFPIMAFIFPAMFLVILGPAFIRIFTAIISRTPQ